MTMISVPVVKQLMKAVGEEKCSVSPENLEKHAHDASSHQPILPEIVLYPTNTFEVSKILQIVYKHSLPITVCGARSGLEGNAIPLKHGIVLDMTRMKKIVKVIKNDFQVIVEPGIIGEELNKELAKFNLYFPAFPASSSIATIGGMIANNAGGMYAVKYGVVGDWVMALEVVLANGEIINVGSRSIKSVAGYDLKSLFIASEGTLGVITKATLKVISCLKQKFLFKVSFPSVENAVAATIESLSENLQPAAMEMLDTSSVRYVNAFKKINWDEATTLLIEIHEKDLGEKKEILERIFKKHQAISYVMAKNDEEMKEIWQCRKSVHPAIMDSGENISMIIGDIGVPLSQIPVFVKEVKKVEEEFKLAMPMFGHIGDGNFHFWIIYDNQQPASFKKAKEASQRLVESALALGGTCTAEHGVGIGKRAYLQKEHPDNIELMKGIKSLLDPQGILNPGKMF